jgi:hypothetical protein
MMPEVFCCLGCGASVDTGSVTCGAEIALPHRGWTGLYKRCINQDYARCAYNIETYRHNDKITETIDEKTVI